MLFGMGGSAVRHGKEGKEGKEGSESKLQRGELILGGPSRAANRSA